MNSVYLKNDRMKTMDEHVSITLVHEKVSLETREVDSSNANVELHQLGDLASFVVDREIEIVANLQTLVKECSPTLLAAHSAMSQLDWYVACRKAPKPQLSVV